MTTTEDTNIAEGLQLALATIGAIPNATDEALLDLRKALARTITEVATEVDKREIEALPERDPDDVADVGDVVTENVTTDLNDDEIALVVVGLNRIARARSTQVHSLSQVEAAKDLLDRLGFPFMEETTPIEIEVGGATEVLPEGETSFPVPNTDGPAREA